MFKFVDRMTKGLDAAALRHKVLSNNLANVNTPSFRRSDVDFGSIFSQSATLAMTTTHKGHISRSSRHGSQVRIIQDTATSMRNDGNNVDLDREIVMILANQLHYQAMTEMISRNLSQLRAVIGEGR